MLPILDFARILLPPNAPLAFSAQELDATVIRAVSIVDDLNHGRGNNTDAGIPMLGWQWGFDESMGLLPKLQQAVEKLRSTVDTIFLLGIGGSYLGPKAAIEACLGTFYNDVLAPKLCFLGFDTDPDYLASCLDRGRGKKIGCVVISKSGTTIETALAFRYIRQILLEEGARESDRIIAVTGDRGSALRRAATEMGFPAFPVPENVGGRYSLFTAVGLVPLLCAGIDVVKLLQGGRDMQRLCDLVDAQGNPALRYAAYRHVLMRKGAVAEYQVTNIARLQSFSHWAVQLEAESEGHQGSGVHVIPVSFPRELHSVGQLLQEGPRNAFAVATTVLTDRNVRMPNYASSGDGLDGLSVSVPHLAAMNEMMLDAALDAHHQGGLPSMCLRLADTSPYSIGAYAYLLMKATAIQGYLLGHNPFVQPGVKLWKQVLADKIAQQP